MKNYNYRPQNLLIIVIYICFIGLDSLWPIAKNVLVDNLPVYRYKFVIIIKEYEYRNKAYF